MEQRAGERREIGEKRVVEKEEEIIPRCGIERKERVFVVAGNSCVGTHTQSTPSGKYSLAAINPLNI